MGLGGLGSERYRALQVGEGLGQVSLLAEHEAEEAVRIGVALVQAEGLVRASRARTSSPRPAAATARW